LPGSTAYAANVSLRWARLLASKGGCRESACAAIHTAIQLAKLGGLPMKYELDQLTAMYTKFCF
jgi:hypothetical protein